MLTFALRTRVLDLVALGDAGHGSWSGRLDRGEMEVGKEEATHCDTEMVESAVAASLRQEMPPTKTDE